MAADSASSSACRARPTGRSRGSRTTPAAAGPRSGLPGARSPDQLRNQNMPDLVGVVLRERYRVEEMLGRGGMADVYLAFDLRRQAYVAIKVLREDLAEDPAFAERFGREAKALSRLDHP